MNNWGENPNVRNKWELRPIIGSVTWTKHGAIPATSSPCQIIVFVFGTQWMMDKSIAFVNPFSYINLERIYKFFFVFFLVGTQGWDIYFSFLWSYFLINQWLILHATYVNVHSFLLPHVHVRKYSTFFCEIR